MSQYASVLLALPLISAFFVPIFKRLNFSVMKYLTSITIIQSVIAGWVFAEVFGIGSGAGDPIIVIISGFNPPIAINLYIGKFAGLFVLVIALVSFFASIFSWKSVEVEPKDKYVMLFLLLMLGSTGMITTGDLFNLFVFMEITVISAYSLTGYNKDISGSEGSIKYIILGGVGSSLFLVGVGLIYGSLGTLNLADIGQKASLMDPLVAKVGMGLIVFGLAVESELFPLNAWAPDAYQGAPHAVTILFSGFVVKSSLYALGRIVYLMRGIGSWNNILSFIVVMGVLTVVIGELSALRQSNVKRMIAYSSIAQVGLIAVGFGLGTTAGVTASVFHMLNHAIVKTLLFLSVGYVAIKIGGPHINNFKGLGRKMPYTSLAITIGAISIVGIPMFNVFWSKIKLILATFAANKGIIVPLILGASLIEFVYYFRLIHRIWFYKPTETKKESNTIKGAMIILILIIILIGIHPILPNPIWEFIQGAGNDIANKAAYIKNVPLTEVVK